MGYINCTQSGMVKERFLVTGTRITKTNHWRKNTGGARHKQRVWVGQNYHPAADNRALGVPCGALLKVMRLKDRTTYITTLQQSSLDLQRVQPPQCTDRLQTGFSNTQMGCSLHLLLLTDL